MNSLSDLNGYGQTEVSYPDSRTAGFNYNLLTPITNTTTTINQGTVQRAVVGIEITEVVNYDEMTNYYEIDLSDVADATVSWPTLPSYMSSSNPSTGVFRVSGFRSVTDWTLVRNPYINLPYEYFGEWSYVSTISATPTGGSASTKTWTTNQTVNDVDTLTIASDFEFTVSASQTVLYTPTIVNELAPTRIYTLVITPSTTSTITTMSSTGTGGASSFNSSSKVLTIVGTRDQVNSHLENLTLSASSTNSHFTLSYEVSNNQIAGTDTKTQRMRCLNILYLSLPTTSGLTYDEDTSGAITGGPTITDEDFDGSGTYTLTVYGTGVRTLSATGTGGSTSFNSSTKVLSIVGTRDQVNSYINNITMLPAADYVSSFNLNYTILTPRNKTATKSQSMTIDQQHDEVSNMIGVNRQYAKNTATLLFGDTSYFDASSTYTLSQSIPQITDLDASASTYSFTLTTNGSHKFSVDNITGVTSYTFSGTKAQCNAQYGLIKFYATMNSTGTIVLTYTQSKNGVQQVNTSVNLTCVNPSGTSKFVKDYIFTTTQTWNTPLDVRTYATTATFWLVGGGGGGTDGGGGGGGGVTEVVGATVTSSSYNIVIGTGGAKYASDNQNNGFYNAMRGGTTSAFGSSAAGGYGGVHYINDSVGTSRGGAAGPYNVSNAGSTGGITIMSGSTCLAGGGGGGAGRSPVINATYPSPGYDNDGYNANYQASYGYNGGAGGAGIELPPGSGKWYAGGGGGKGGTAEYSLGGGQYNVNWGGPFTAYNTNTYNGWAGGGRGTAVGDNDVNYIDGSDGANGKKGGGGGGGTLATGLGNGGDGVVIIRYV